MIELEYRDNSFNFSNLISVYEEACDWLNALGIDYRPTRFKTYHDDSRILFNEGAKRINDYSNEQELQGVMKRFLNANREIQELIRVVRALKSIEDSNSFISQLKKMTAGSVFRTINQKDQSRNFSFELDVASRFVFAGYQVELGGAADIKVIINGVNLYVECKRISSMSKLGVRIKSANEQLERRLARDPSKKSRGMVAVEVSQLIGIEESILGFRSSKCLWDMSANLINDFVMENESDFYKGSAVRLLGVLAQITFPSFIHGDGDVMVAAARSSSILPYKKRNSDEIFLSEFWRKLGNQVD